MRRAYDWDRDATGNSNRIPSLVPPYSYDMHFESLILVPVDASKLYYCSLSPYRQCQCQPVEAQQAEFCRRTFSRYTKW